MFFEARRDTLEVLDFVKEALDVVAFLVEGLGEAMANLTVDLSRECSAPRPAPQSVL
jgi:hypothetical protein